MTTYPPLLPGAKLDDIPRHWASHSPDAPALAEQHGVTSFGALEQAIRDAAAALKGLGVQRGDRVLLVGENCGALVFFLFAASRLGAAFVLVNARLSGPEIDAIARHAAPRVELYVDAGHKDAVVHALRRGAAPIDSGRAGSVHALVGREDADETLTDVAALIYTSGTTGTPKGVMLRHSGLLFIADTLVSLRGMSPADRSYGVLPMSHTMGLTSVLLSTLLAGGTVVVRPRFEVTELVGAIEDCGLTMFQGVQAMYASLLNHLKTSDRPLRSSSLRYIYAGGSPLDPTLKAEVEQLFGLPLHNGYGMTESSPTICHSRFGEYRADAAVGPPIPGVEVRIVDPAGQDLSPGGEGELWMRGPGLMKGYFRDPASTQTALREGWLRSGDLARMDEEGNVHLVGRIKDVIIRSGFNVYPAEVEAAINAHALVQQSAVVGRTVERNEEVVAFVQPKAGASLTTAELQAFVGLRLSPYKRPAQIVFLAELPQMANGKVRRTALKELAAQPAAPASPIVPTVQRIPS